MDAFEFRAGKIGADQFGIRQIGAGEIGARRIRAIERRCIEIGIGQHGPAQIAIAKVGIAEVGGAQIEPLQACAVQLGSREFSAGQRCGIHLQQDGARRLMSNLDHFRTLGSNGPGMPVQLIRISTRLTCSLSRLRDAAYALAPRSGENYTTPAGRLLSRNGSCIGEKTKFLVCFWAGNFDGPCVAYSAKQRISRCAVAEALGESSSAHVLPKCRQPGLGEGCPDGKRGRER